MARRNVPGGLSSRFAKLMQSNVMVEYGLEPHEQSALNLVYLLGWNAQNSLSPVNGADEKYSVHGGNDLIVSRMLEQLPVGHRPLRQQAHRRPQRTPTVRCGSTFGSASRPSDATADRVILALPFTHPARRRSLPVRLLGAQAARDR